MKWKGRRQSSNVIDKRVPKNSARLTNKTEMKNQKPTTKDKLWSKYINPGRTTAKRMRNLGNK